MAGLAAALNVPGRIDALSDALAARGADVAMLRVDGFDGAVVDLAVRAGLPAVPRVVGGTDRRVLAGLAVDGIASATALDAGYAARGPEGLFDRDEPYAVILADAEQDRLVLARNGDGPGLYYARYEQGWLAASEPAALLRAGVPAEPDPEVVARFVDSGACDESRRTFLRGVRRVRSSEAVVLTTDGAADVVSGPSAANPPDVTAVLQKAVATGRIGLLLGPGLAGAAVLGAALARADRLRPLPVHTGPGATPALLESVGGAAVCHHPHPLDPRELDLDAFLTEMGEPVPDLRLYLSWHVARTLGGEIDVLVDSAGGPRAVVGRVRDRIEARYGVAVRTPMREVGPLADEVLESLVDGSLPAAAADAAARDPSATTGAAEVLLAVPEAVAAALARPRPWLDRAVSIDGLRRLTAGAQVDADALLRAYLVERWLDTLPQPEPDVPLAPPARSRRLLPADDVHVDGVTWSRVRVHTEVLVPGDHVTGKAAFHATTAIAEICADPSNREAMRAPWFAILSGRALAVSQQRVSPLWNIKPGRMARFLARLARRRSPHLSEAWTMQVALADGGRLRVAAAVVLATVSPRRGERMLPDPAVLLYPPRAGAVPPGEGAVVRSPEQPDRAAAALVDALRYTAPESAVSTLAGCAVVSADETGSRLLGFAPGPNADVVPDAESVVAHLCADNPAGQNHEQTPVVLAYATSRWRAADSQEAPEFRVNPEKSTVDRSGVPLRQ